MPALDFLCEKCGARFELSVRFTDSPPAVHEGGCGGPLRRDFGAGVPGTVYKGKGWAKRDRKIRSQI